ncbi:hypothetical protein [Nocardia sp. NPDC050175]|uniref:hypothetical protein n=1 Tax=Nocardia sp. NPDC050175 TaxID=3364317 RepID=UPI0037AAB3C3
MSHFEKALSDIVSGPTSVLGPSWYDTARVVRSRLRRPDALPAAMVTPAIDRLLRAQLPDGSWGYRYAPREYRVVPTLSAAEALLALAEVGEVRAGPAAAHALDFLGSVRIAPRSLPDTIAVEFIVPALLEAMADRLAHPAIRVALHHHRAELTGLHRLRYAAAHGALPPSAHHSLEVLAELPANYRHADYLAADGSLACSPAATAAALAWSDRPAPAALDYLRLEGNRLNGAWPTVAPVRIFELSWLIGAAAHAGVSVRPSTARPLARWLAAQLGETGCGAGPALAADSDDTAIVLFALAALGVHRDPAELRQYKQADRFCTFVGERTASCSANAHVLEVLAVRWRRGSREAHIQRGLATATGYLLETQSVDGFWLDKWHASPFYATAAAVFALRTVSDPAAARAVERAISWTCAQQREDGSWGRWSGTREETAHAVSILVDTDRLAAVRAGADFLRHAPSIETPLWHGKELYEPTRIVDEFVAMISAAAARVLPATEPAEGAAG